MSPAPSAAPLQRDLQDTSMHRVLVRTSLCPPSDRVHELHLRARLLPGLQCKRLRGYTRQTSVMWLGWSLLYWNVLLS